MNSIFPFEKMVPQLTEYIELLILPLRKTQLHNTISTVCCAHSGMMVSWYYGILALWHSGVMVESAVAGLGIAHWILYIMYYI